MRSRVLLAAALLVSLAGCKRESGLEPTIFPVVAPDTYAFENVSFSGQTDRLNQLGELVDYVETANEEGIVLDAQVMKDMFENTGDNGGGHFSFSSSKQLKNKCFELDQATMEGYFETVAFISASTETGANGTAGRIMSLDQSSSRLYDANGWEYEEFIEKSIMGAVFYYQALNTYLGDAGMDVDNSVVEEGKGTEMQHHFDEAYGYLGVTTAFPENTEDVRYWGKYAVSRDEAIGSATKLSDAFRLGRAAIVLERYDERDEAIATIVKEWEKLCASQAVHYLNESLGNMADDYQRNHVLSEAYAFVNNLFYNPDRTITDSQMTAVRNYIGTNFYEVTVADLTAARDLLAEIHGLEDVKETL